MEHGTTPFGGHWVELIGGGLAWCDRDPCDLTFHEFSPPEPTPFQQYLQDAMGPAAEWLMNTAAQHEATLKPGAEPTLDVYKYMPQPVMISHEMLMDVGAHACSPTCPQWVPPPPPPTRRQEIRRKWQARGRRAWWTVRHLHEFRLVHRSDIVREDCE